MPQIVFLNGGQALAHRPHRRSVGRARGHLAPRLRVPRRPGRAPGRHRARRGRRELRRGRLLRARLYEQLDRKPSPPPLASGKQLVGLRVPGRKLLQRRKRRRGRRRERRGRYMHDALRLLPGEPFLHGPRLLPGHRAPTCLLPPSEAPATPPRRGTGWWSSTTTRPTSPYGSIMGVVDAGSWTPIRPPGRILVHSRSLPRHPAPWIRRRRGRHRLRGGDGLDLRRCRSSSTRNTSGRNPVVRAAGGGAIVAYEAVDSAELRGLARQDDERGARPRGYRRSVRGRGRAALVHPLRHRRDDDPLTYEAVEPPGGLDLRHRHPDLHLDARLRPGGGLRRHRFSVSDGTARTPRRSPSP